jgi:Protein of unknown function (DUF4254)
MNTPAPITAAAVKALHDARLNDPLAPAPNASDIWRWVGENHRNNYLLWDQEDLARRNDAPASDIMANKRAIDGYNQARNDAIEKTDEYLLIALGLISAQEAASTAPQASIAPGARLNSETAGSMVDRMSIVALKIRAMTAQTLRSDVSAEFTAQCQAKLARLHEQRNDLGDCLDHLLADSLSGHAYFKVYRQFKMYNDPHLNPVLVAERNAA